jgi:two-component system chemotaxis response regulator CheB
MPRDIIVLGASAGGIEALQAIVKTLPAKLEASLFVVVHIPSHSPSNLPHILSAAGPIKAVHAQDGAAIERNRIYIAPPDKHMILDAGKIVVRRGPKENRFRPSVDALFRSAAYVYGSRVIGVVLWSIKRLGGLAVIQDPNDALYPEMPRNVTEHVEVDHVAPASAIGALLAKLCCVNPTSSHNVDKEDLRRLACEVEISGYGGAFEKGIMDWGAMAAFTCPECHGALVKITEGSILRYRCHTGHAFTPSTLLAGITEAVEETLWQAMRGVEEQAMMLEHLASHLRASGRDDAAQRFVEKARHARDQAQIIHDSIPEHEQLSADSASAD